mmetsp:Transcript_41286/g.108379  ORF Transcript_41286/g.108379 Transcript_41286/m.108379 type:complete len:615 (+) Transcript_41286:21-1865(+)
MAEDELFVVEDTTHYPSWSVASKPVQLLHLQKHAAGKEKFIIGEEARRMLVDVAANSPVVIICVCGLYRTGKSFLLNRLCSQAPEAPTAAFEVGDTVNACTDGIWMWGSGELDGKIYLILDCEGSGNTENERQHDAQLFAMAVLLSSYFIYNAKGVIDETAIQTLSVVTSMATHVAKSNPGWEAPHFMWVLRDFVLSLEDQSGRPMTATEYLETALSDRSSAAWRREDSKEARQRLVDLFQRRDCVTMVQPVIEEDDLQNLKSLPDSRLRPEFRGQLVQLRRKVFRDAEPKAVNGQKVTGKGLVRLMDEFVEAFNAGRVPSVTTAWASVSASECQRALDEATVFAEASKASLLAQLPMPAPEMTKALVKLKVDALAKFRSIALGDESAVKQYREDLSERVDSFAGPVVGENSRRTKEVCEELAADLWRPLKRKLEMQEYQDEAGFEADIKEFEGHYKERARGDDTTVNAVLTQFLRTRREAGLALMGAKKQGAEEEERLRLEQERVEAEIQAETMRKLVEEKRKEAAEEQQKDAELFDVLDKKNEEAEKSRALREQMREEENKTKLAEMQAKVEESNRKAKELEEQLKRLNVTEGKSGDPPPEKKQPKCGCAVQ